MNAVHDLAGHVLAEQAGSLPPDLTARMMMAEDADMIRALRAEVIAALDDPDFYDTRGETGDFVADHLGLVGVTAGLFAGERLVAYGALGLPGENDPNRGRDLDLPAAELRSVAHMASAMASQTLRGRGLHHFLIDWRSATAIAAGRRHLITTVSTRNHQSWGHLAAHGLHPKRRLVLQSGLVRFLVHRDIQDNASPDRNTMRHIPVADLATIPDPFENGDRIWGRANIAGTWCAILARPYAPPS